MREKFMLLKYSSHAWEALRELNVKSFFRKKKQQLEKMFLKKYFFVSHVWALSERTRENIHFTVF